MLFFAIGYVSYEKIFVSLRVKKEGQNRLERK